VTNILLYYMALK